MARTNVPVPSLSAQPTHTDQNDCPHRQGPACPICAVTDELIRIFNRPTLTEQLLKFLAR
jgi:hypothetical protein